MRKISSHEGLRKYFFNTVWLFLVQGLRLFLGFFVGLWLARYLGPSDFGIYNFVASVNLILLSIASLGVNDILVKELVEKKDRENEALSAAFVLRLVGGLVASVTCILYATVIQQDDSIRYFLLISLPILLFQAFEVVESFYIARVRVRESARCRIYQLLISSALKIYFITSGGNLSYFIWLSMFDIVFYLVLIFITFKSQVPSFKFVVPHRERLTSLLNASLPVMIIALTQMVFAKSNQIILGTMEDQAQVGLYSAAIRVIELVSIFFVIILQSLSPAVIGAKSTGGDYLQRLRNISRLVVLMGLVFTVFTFNFSEEVTILLYGVGFAQSAESLAILSLSFAFVGMSYVSYQWYIAENLQGFLMVKFLLLSAFHLSLSLVLVPSYGIRGAAASYLVTCVVFFFLYEAFFKKTRQCFRINCLIK